MILEDMLRRVCRRGAVLSILVFVSIEGTPHHGFVSDDIDDELDRRLSPL